MSKSMTAIPERIKLSKKASERLRYIKSQTGITPNIVARMAIMLAIREGGNLRNSGFADSDGLEINKTTLFGEHALVYEIFINQYIHEKSLEQPPGEIVALLIEVGAFKLAHVRNLLDLCDATEN